MANSDSPTPAAPDAPVSPVPVAAFDTAPDNPPVTEPTATPPKESRATRIIKNVLMNWVAYATTILTSFFMSPFLVHHLHDSVYGVWVLIGSLAGYLGLLDFGLTPATTKHVAEYRARNDQAAMNRLVSGGLMVYSGLGLVVLAVSALIAWRFNHLFHTTLTDQTAFIVVMIAGLNLALTFPASIFLGILRGYQRYDVDAAVTSFTILMQSALIILMIERGYGIFALVSLKFLFDMGRLVYIVHFVRRLNPELHIARTHLDWGEMKQLFGYSSFFFLIMVGNQINFLTDSIVIATFLSTAFVTVYSIANRLITYLRELVIEMTGVLMPAISGMHAGQDDSKVRELHILATKYMLLLALPLGAIFFILGDVFIRRWMGPGYEMSALLLKILTVAIIANLIAGPTGSVLTGLGKHHIVAKFTLAQALTNLVLSLILVRPYGLIGVSLGTAISMVVFTLIALPIYIQYHLKLSLIGYLRDSMLLPVIIQPFYIGLLLLLRNFVFPTSLWMFFAEVIFSFVPYAVLVYMCCMSQPERAIFARFLHRSNGKLAANA